MNSSEMAVAAGEAPPAAAEASRGLQRRVLALAGPVIGENLLQTLLGVVDTILVSWLGVVALAGVGAGLQVIFVLIGALSALSVGASVLVAQAVGAGDKLAAGRFARQALIWSVLVSVPLSLAGLALTEPLIALFGLEPAVARVAIDYLHVTIGSVATIIVLLIGGGVLRGAGDSRTPLLVTAIANVINVALAYGLIYGHWGLPALGAVGSAWATFASRLVGAALLVWALVQGRNGVSIAGRNWLPQLGVARDVLKIGLPAALEEVLVITGIAALTPIVAGLGTVSLAAHRVVINVLSLSFLPGIGFGLAATALVGQSVGAARYGEARAIASIALRWALAWMSALGLVFAIWAPQLVRLFINEPTPDNLALVDVGALTLRVMALTQPLWAASFVYAGALRGTGNTRTPLLITGVSIWVAVLVAWLGVHVVQPHLATVWFAFLVSGPIEVYFFRRAWKGWRRG